MAGTVYKLFRWSEEQCKWLAVAGTFRTGCGATQAAIRTIDKQAPERVQLLIGSRCAGMPPSQLGWEVGQPFDSVPDWIRRKHKSA